MELLASPIIFQMCLGHEKMPDEIEHVEKQCQSLWWISVCAKLVTPQQTWQ